MSKARKWMKMQQHKLARFSDFPFFAATYIKQDFETTNLTLW